MSESKISSARVIGLGVGLVTLGAVGFHEIPGMITEDAEGTKWVNSIYCAVITLTTVGFGDICPGEITGPGRAFIVFLAFAGLGMFCGPIMDLAASWKDMAPVGGTVALLSFTVMTAVFVFCHLLEEMSQSEAAYFSIITGTTIGYGDISPKTDVGKIAVAIYAVLAVNVVASILEPAKEVLLGFCLVREESEDKIVQELKATSKSRKASEESSDDAGNETPKTKKKRKKKKASGSQADETKKDKYA